MGSTYAELAASDEVAAADWFALAQKSREAGDTVTATAALDKAAAESPPARVSLERARIAVVSTDADGAIAELERLFTTGFTAVQVITGDELLGSLAGSPSFDRLVADMSRQAFPCEHNERFAEFDFWLGHWEVRTADGQFAGRNRIERAERGCVLTEHWVGTGGSTGMSINYVDRVSDEWVQIWNAAGGSQIHIRGGLTEDGMRLVGTIHYVANGTTAPFRGLWTRLDDGRVRQYFEQSNDDGTTWSPWFEGFYTRTDSAEDK